MNQTLHQDPRPNQRVLVTAHRGASAEAPENTLSAIGLAIGQGADWVEIDVQEAGDGTLVLLHDSDLLRVAGDPRGVWELDRATLARLDAGAWFSPNFAGEPIPTLAEVLDLARGRVRLNIEIKHHGHERRLVERVLDLVRAAGMGDGCLLTSLELDALRRVRALAPQMRIGWIVTADPGDPRGLDLDALSLDLSLATPRLVRACQAAGVDTQVWTVNARDDMVRLIDLGVTGIITDRPALLRRVLDAHQGPDQAGTVPPTPAA
jgi:glycerophosphoryl diester phosphodiesterase